MRLSEKFHCEERHQSLDLGGGQFAGSGGLIEECFDSDGVRGDALPTFIGLLLRQLTRFEQGSNPLEPKFLTHIGLTTDPIVGI